GASAVVIASNSGCASFSESSWYCFLKPHVPSTAEHFSTTLTSAPGIRRRISADLSPIFCARRWHGAWYVTAPTDRVNLVSSLPSARSSARYSKRSRVLRATSFASSEPSSHGYSCLSMSLHVGPGTNIVTPP